MRADIAWEELRLVFLRHPHFDTRTYYTIYILHDTHVHIALVCVFLDCPLQIHETSWFWNRRVMAKHQKSNMCVIIGNHQKSKHKEHDSVSSQIDLNVLVDRE